MSLDAALRALSDADLERAIDIEHHQPGSLQLPPGVEYAPPNMLQFLLHERERREANFTKQA